MEEKKSFEKWIGVLSVAIIAIVAIVFVTITTNKNFSKGTYGLTQCNCDAYPGYSLVDGRTCIKYNEDTQTCLIDANSNTCESLIASGYTCTAVGGGSNYARYSCSKSTQDTKAATCVEVCQGYYTSSTACQNGTHSVCTVAKTEYNTSCYQGSSNCISGYYYSGGSCVPNSSFTPGCYFADHEYVWWTTAPGSAWTAVSKTQSACHGCESGYAYNADEQCVPESSLGAGCYLVDHEYVWSNTRIDGGQIVDLSQANCKGCQPGYGKNGLNKCVQLACYVIDGKYTWTTGGGTKTSKTENQCTGCAAGYKESGSTCVRDCGKHATSTENGCVCDLGYYMEGTQCVKASGYCDSGVPGDCDGKLNNPDWNCTEEGMGPAGMVYHCVYVGSESVTATVTLVYNNGNQTTKSCVINAGQDSCTITVTGNWGAKNCVNGVSSFIMTRTRLTDTYYECCCVDCGNPTTTPAKTTTKGPTGGTNPTTTKPTGGAHPTTAKPTGGTQPTTAKPTGGTQPTTAKPTTKKPTTVRPTGGTQPTTAKPTTKKPTTTPTTPENPQTGASTMIIVWMIALATIGYSVWYFKRSSTN